MKFTILGSKGFIGLNSNKYFFHSGINYSAPEREGKKIEYDIGSKEAFSILSRMWFKSG